MAPIKLNKRETTALAVLGLAALGYLYYTYAVMPQVSALKAENDKANALRVELAKAEKASDYLSKWNEAVSLAKSANAELPLPKGVNLAPFITAITGIANENKVKLLSIAPTAPAEEGEYFKVQMALSIMGSYQASVSFLDALKDCSETFVVTEAKVSPGTVQGTQAQAGGAGSAQVQAQVNGLNIDLRGFTLLARVEVSPDGSIGSGAGAGASASTGAGAEGTR